MTRDLQLRWEDCCCCCLRYSLSTLRPKRKTTSIWFTFSIGCRSCLRAQFLWTSVKSLIQPCRCTTLSAPNTSTFQ
jgi:hypothetical protein